MKFTRAVSVSINVAMIIQVSRENVAGSIILQEMLVATLT